MAFRTSGSGAATVALTLPAVLFVTNEILAEYSEVLSRPELRIPADESKALIDLITERSSMVAPTRRLLVCPDPDDNIFLECAEASRTDYLITGNAKHFPTYWRNTKVINARELLNIIGPHLPV